MVTTKFRLRNRLLYIVFSVQLKQYLPFYRDEEDEDEESEIEESPVKVKQLLHPQLYKCFPVNVFIY